MKCPRCKKGKFRLAMYQPRHVGFTRQRAVLMCDECKYKDVFE